MSRIRSVSLSLLLALLTWSGQTPAEASTALDLARSVPIYDYDAPIAGVGQTCDDAVRGSLVAATRSASVFSADVPSRAASVRSSSTCQAQKYMYNASRSFGQTDSHQRNVGYLGREGEPGAATSDQFSLAVGGVAANGADEAFSAGRYLKDSWYKSTFPNRTQSVQYHPAQHGNGRTAVEYTRDAMDFFAQNQSLGKAVIPRDGTAGIKIATKQPLPGGGVQKVGGYWTSDGRLVTFWD